MSVIDTFYILFKSNADETKRSFSDVDRSAKETEKNLRGVTDQSDKLGQSFVKMIESGAAFAGVFAGFNIVKAGVVQQNEYNKQLFITSQLYRQHAGDIKALSQAAAQAGGSKEGALSNIASLAQTGALRNLSYDPLQHLKAARSLYQSYANSPASQAAMLFGPSAVFQEQGMQNLLRMSDKDFNKILGSTGVKAAGTLTDEQAKQAFEAVQASEDLKGSIGKLETTIASTLTGTLNSLIGKLSELISSLGGSSIGSAAGAAAVIGGTAIGTKTAIGMLSRAVGIGGTRAAVGGAAAAAGGIGMAGLAGEALMYGGGGVLAGYGAVSLFQDQIESWLVRQMTSDLKQPGAAKRSKMGGADMDFWRSKGYTSNQAAGIMANLMKESGGDPNAVGDGGAAKGMAQWHNDRRQKILHATGIDVWNSSREDQLKAAAWEMQHGDTGFSDTHFRSLGGADLSGAYFSSHFERPAGGFDEALRRGRSALSIASQYQGASGGNSVHIDKIEIHTSATDTQEIARHIKTALIGACSDVQAKADNGRAS